MVNVEGEVFIRKFGGEFVHQSKFAAPTEKEALGRFNGCLHACQKQLKESFYSHPELDYTARLKKELDQVRKKIAEQQKKKNVMDAEARMAYRDWVKE